jgi:hypothetical protein
LYGGHGGLGDHVKHAHSIDSAFQPLTASDDDKDWGEEVEEVVKGLKRKRKKGKVQTTDDDDWVHDERIFNNFSNDPMIIEGNVYVSQKTIDVDVDFQSHDRSSSPSAPHPRDSPSPTPPNSPLHTPINSSDDDSDWSSLEEQKEHRHLRLKLLVRVCFPIGTGLYWADQVGPCQCCFYLMHL